MVVNSNRKATLAVIAVVVFATAAFILAHSLQGSDASWAESNAIAALLGPVLRGLVGLVGEAAAWFGHATPLSYEAFVRKLAHFVEYSALGAECMAVTVVVTGRAVSPYVLVDLSAVLAIAAVDECLQALVGRTSLVADVLLDFSGGAAGVVLALVVAGIVLRCRRGGIAAP